MNENKQRVSKELKRDEVTKELVEKIYKEFSSPVIDLKKDYTVTSKNSIYRTQGWVRTCENDSPTCVEYQVVTEPRFADIVAIVKIIETRCVP